MQLALGMAAMINIIFLMSFAPAAETAWCKAGQEHVTGLNFSCINCAQGKYKATAGSGICSSCPADTFSSSERAPDLIDATPFVPPASLGDFGAAAISGMVHSHKRNRLYLSDHSRHQIMEAVVEHKSVAQTAVVAGSGTSGPQNGIGTLARFTAPSDIDLTPDGSALVVADSGNHLVRKITLKEAVGVPQFTVYSLGYPGKGGFVDGSDASIPRCRFYTPTGVRVHTNGSIFVVDSYTSKVRLISSDFVSVTSMDSIAGLSHARRLVFAADSEHIIISTSSGLMATRANKLTEVRIADSATIKVVGAGDAGTMDGSGHLAQFNRPLAMEWNAEGALMVGQEGDGAIRLVDWDTGNVSTIFPATTASFYRMLGSSALAYTPQARASNNRTNGVYVGAFTGKWPAWQVRLLQWNAGATACTPCSLGGSAAGSISVLDCNASKPVSFRPSTSTITMAVSTSYPAPATTPAPLPPNTSGTPLSSSGTPLSTNTSTVSTSRPIVITSPPPQGASTPPPANVSRVASALQTTVSSLVVGAVATSVASSVATSIGLSMSGGMTSSLGGAAQGGRGGSGSMAAVTQVQMLSQIGRVGGSRRSKSLSTASCGFGWANYNPSALGVRRFLGRQSPKYCDDFASARGGSCSAEGEPTPPLNAPEIPPECLTCGWDTVADSVEQVVLCAVCLLLVAGARAASCKAMVSLFRQEPSASMAFPMWEAPVFATQFMGLTESLMVLARNDCFDVKVVSSMLLFAGPGFFTAYAATRIYRHVMRDGSLEFQASEKPSWECFKQSMASASFFGKIFVLHDFIMSSRDRGSWGDDNEHERHWMFMVGDFTRSGVFYCVWLLLRKIIVIFIMEHLEGTVNASAACALQFVDTALLFLLMPFNDWQTMGAEGIAGVSSLVAYFSLSLPVFGFDIPFLDFTDDVKLLIASMGSLLAGLSSFTTSVAHLFSAASQCYGMLQNSGIVFLVASESGAGGLVAGFMADEVYEQARAKALGGTPAAADGTSSIERHPLGRSQVEVDSLDPSRRDRNLPLGGDLPSADNSAFAQSLFASEVALAGAAMIAPPTADLSSLEAHAMPRSQPLICSPRPPRRSPHHAHPSGAAFPTQRAGDIADREAKSREASAGDVDSPAVRLLNAPLTSSLELTSKPSDGPGPGVSYTCPDSGLPHLAESDARHHGATQAASAPSSSSERQTATSAAGSHADFVIVGNAGTSTPWPLFRKRPFVTFQGPGRAVDKVGIADFMARPSEVQVQSSFGEDRLGQPRQQVSFQDPHVKEQLDLLAGEPPVRPPPSQARDTEHAAEMREGDRDDLLLQAFSDVFTLGPASSHTISTQDGRITSECHPAFHDRGKLYKF